MIAAKQGVYFCAHLDRLAVHLDGGAQTILLVGKHEIALVLLCARSVNHAANVEKRGGPLDARAVRRKNDALLALAASGDLWHKERKRAMDASKRARAAGEFPSVSHHGARIRNSCVRAYYHNRHKTNRIAAKTRLAL